MPQKNLSEVNPLESLGNATAPLDNIWKGIGSKLNIQSLEHIKNFLSTGTSKPLKSSLEESLGSQDTSTMGRALGMAGSIFILIANILVVVLEIALWALKGILGLIT